jgi:D-glycero-D-manno-heptose 1,7-bisphosphate phosphatase
MILKPAIFLDRDGVINQYPGDRKYVENEQGFILLPGVRKALESLCAAPYAIFIVSNQAGVAKKLYSQKTLEAITAKMQTELGSRVHFDGILYCTHHPDDNCSCRKPAIGLIFQAESLFKKEGFTLDRARSFFIGDSIVDIVTAYNAGIPSILVQCGRKEPVDPENWDDKPGYVASDLSEAVSIILHEHLSFP